MPNVSRSTNDRGTSKLSKKTSKSVRQAGSPRCLEVAEAGIRTGDDFALFMSYCMGDLVSGRLAPRPGQAAINAAGKLLAVVEMRYRYGIKRSGEEPEDIVLTHESNGVLSAIS